MNRKRAGLVIIILTLNDVQGLWELWGREAIAYDSILVLKEDAAAGIIIEKEDMTTAKVEKAPDGALTPKDIESLAGMRTAQYVAGRAPFDERIFRAVPVLHGGGFSEGRSRFADGLAAVMSADGEAWRYSYSLRRGHRTDGCNCDTCKRQ